MAMKAIRQMLICEQVLLNLKETLLWYRSSLDVILRALIISFVQGVLVSTRF